MANYRIKRLLNEVKRFRKTPRNHRLMELWEHGGERVLGVHPIGCIPAKKGPLTVDFTTPTWGRLLGFSVKEFFTMPETYLECSLRAMIYRFRELKDDSPLWDKIQIFFGVGFETSLFGYVPIYFADQDPWIPQEPIIKSEEDLDRMVLPDFYENGLMPRACEFCEKISKLAGDDLTFIFPEWIKGPFALLHHLRGVTNIIRDMYTRPEFVHRLMRFITDARKRWFKARDAFLGCKDVKKGVLGNDEVGVLSPRLYEEFVLPYEVELSEFHGGIRYFHSCGNITALLNLIRRIPRLDLLHIGPWTNLSEAVEVFGGTVRYDIRLDPVREGSNAKEDETKSKITSILDACDDKIFSISLDSVEIKDVNNDLRKVKRWMGWVRPLLARDSI